MTQLNMTRFARLVAYIASKSSSDYNQYEIAALEGFVKDCISVETALSRITAITAEDVRMLIKYIGRNDKYDALRKYRKMTGDNLQDCKYAIDQAMPGYDSAFESADS